VTPAWEPHSDRVLAYATTGGAIATVDVDTGRTIWTTASSSPEAMAWVGNRLFALSSRSVTVLAEGGRVVRRIPLPGVAREIAVHPSGGRAAVVIGNRVVEVGLRESFRRQLFQGSVDGIAWSQDGRHLLVGWRNADQWLLLGPGRRVRALHGVSRALGAAGGFPRVAGWCCAD
jgi:outer membrane protein assembly factor BamB